MASIVDILGWRNISTAVQAVESGVPNRLPPAFMNLKENVDADRTTWITFYGQRQTPKQVAYGSQSKPSDLKKIGEKSATLIQFAEHVKIRQELMLRLRNPNDLLAQQMAKEEVVRHAMDFRTKFDNGRIVAVTSMLANGKIWFDSSGNLLSSSSGADSSKTIDPSIHANNLNQLNSIIDASWATDTTNIAQHVENVKIQMRKNTGRELKHVFYGKNIAQYLFRNATMKTYWAFNESKYKAFAADPGTVPDGLFGLSWHFMGDTFFHDSTDSNQAIWGDDTVTFTPEIDRNFYTLFEGIMPVPVMGIPRIASGLIEASGEFEYVHGMGGYAVPELDPVGIKQVFFDTYLPGFKTAAVNGTDPGDIFIADVTP